MSDSSASGAARPTSLTVLSTFGSFATGPIVGIALARLLAPESHLAEAIGMFAFPIAFALGLQAWLGLAIVTALVELVRRWTSGEAVRRSATHDVPSGSFVFVPMATAAGLLAGVPIGWLSPTHSIVDAVLLYTAAGAAYGVAVWQLARSGYLPFPQPAA